MKSLKAGVANRCELDAHRRPCLEGKGGMVILRWNKVPRSKLYENNVLTLLS